MRNRFAPLVLLISATVACHKSDQGGDAGARKEGAEIAGSRGPDPVLLRLPRAGGTVRAYLYPKLDSVVWTGDGSSVDRVLGFDPEGGTLAIITRKGIPERIDLRLGEAGEASASARLTSLASANGADIYGVDPKGTVVRLTRSGDWSFTPPSPARVVFPQGDGSLVVAAQRGHDAVLWRIRPPESRILDTTILSVNLRGARAQVGDRVYFGTDTGLVGVQVRDLSVVPTIHFPDRIVAIAPTPSGDRMYATTAAERGVSVIDRYTDKVVTEIPLPGLVSELRMDPLGRYVIAKPVHGDSAWVIGVATDHLIGSVQTVWTGDLPACAPDGAIAVNTGRDVVFLDGETLQPVRTVVGGAADYWYFMFWNGFRARAAGLDQPVTFAHADTGAPAKDSTADSAAVLDSIANAATGPRPTSTVPAPASAAAAAGTGAPAQPATTLPPAGALPQAKSTKPQTFSVSFAALLDEQKARTMANAIVVNGTTAHVVAAKRAGTMVYRVVLGPYPTHEAAAAAGHAAQRSGPAAQQQAFWVYPDEP